MLAKDVLLYRSERLVVLGSISIFDNVSEYFGLMANPN